MSVDYSAVIGVGIKTTNKIAQKIIDKDDYFTRLGDNAYYNLNDDDEVKLGSSWITCDADDDLEDITELFTQIAPFKQEVFNRLSKLIQSTPELGEYKAFLDINNYRVYLGVNVW